MTRTSSDAVMAQKGAPGPVKLVGIFWLWLGGLGIASGLWLQIGPRLAPATSTFPLSGTGLSAISLAQLAFGALAIPSAIGFLRLKSWTRPVIEALTWLVVLAFLGTQAVALHGILSLHGGHGAIAASFLLGGAVFLVPCFLALRAVRGPAIRAAFGGTPRHGSAARAG